MKRFVFLLFVTIMTYKLEAHKSVDSVIHAYQTVMDCMDKNKKFLPEETVKTIRKHLITVYDCFNGCISIENKVVLPATITKIGGLAFGGKMKSGNFELELHATVPPTNKPDNICDGTTLKAIYVPAGSVDAYKESTIGQYGDKIMAIGLE